MRSTLIPGLVVALAAMVTQGCKNIEEGQAATGTIGATCEEAGDCTQVVGEAPVCLKMPAGYCSIDCIGGFFDCDDQSICEALGDQAYYCLDGCLTDNGNDDCRGDYRCSARPEVINADGREVGVCVPKCEQNADCEAGRRCDVASGDCVPKGERGTGDACTTNGSCNGGLCIQSAEFRGGYCSAQCSSQFGECEPGSVCETIDGAAVCLNTCDGDGDCRGDEGYICAKVGEKNDSNGDLQDVKACVPRCQSDAACGDGNFCDASDGLCKPGAGDPNPVGAFCATDDDCESGDCLQANGWLNGYCTAGCGACGDGVCGTTTEGDTCLAACDVNLDCRPGYICGADSGCKAPCLDDSECGGGEVCLRSGLCGTRAANAGDVTEVLIADSVQVGGSLSDELVIDVPSDAISFAVLADGAGDDLMVIGEMIDPDGRTVYDFQDPFGSEFRFFPSADQITQFVPSDPRSVPMPGEYRFRLIKEGSTSDIRVTALIKTADGEPDRGTLNVNFVFARVSGLDAGSASSDGDFQAAVTEMERILGTRDIEVGEVAYCDLPDSERDRFGVIDSVDGASSELSRMFQISDRLGDFGCQAEDAVNFFLVDEIVGGRAGFIILGIAGGIPGPATINGTTHSGVAVTMTGFRRSPVQLAQTMAHEGGHYLGLFHTTEAEGTAHDPLIDTDECDQSRDRNRDGVVTTDECGGVGAQYLMFWAAGDTAEEVTADQQSILVRNPAIK